MKKLTSIAPLACVAIAALMLAMPGQASAQCGNGYGFGAYGGPFGTGFGGFGSPYATGRIPTPPYFALHPPVYYSAPVARSYGYSPFAYPGDVRTPDAPAAGQAKVIINPYVEQVQPVKAEAEESKKEAADNDVAQSKSLMIVNPYVSEDIIVEGAVVKN
ncbi:MAG: hypothetical protein AAF497_00385 [Planctomycetota bacterium]